MSSPHCMRCKLHRMETHALLDRLYARCCESSMHLQATYIQANAQQQCMHVQCWNGQKRKAYIGTMNLHTIEPCIQSIPGSLSELVNNLQQTRKLKCNPDFQVWDACVGCVMVQTSRIHLPLKSSSYDTLLVSCVTQCDSESSSIFGTQA